MTARKSYPDKPDPNHPDYHPDGSPELWGTLDYGSCEDPGLHRAGWYGPFPPVNYGEPIDDEIRRLLGGDGLAEKLRLVFTERREAFWLLKRAASIMRYREVNDELVRDIDEWEKKRDALFPWAREG